MKKVELTKLISEKVSKAAEKEVSNIDSYVTNLIKASISSLLGISNSWNRTEIDHCNGRNSILTAIIEEKAKKQVEKLVMTFKFDENDKDVLGAFRREFKTQLDRRIKWHAEELSKQVASTIINKFTQKELEKIGFEKDPEIKTEVRY